MSSYKWDFAAVFWPPEFWIKGALVTIAYAVATAAAGCVLGLILGPALLSRSRLVRLPVYVYVQVFRCTPLLVQIVWFYYALPIVLGIDLPAWFAAGIGLSLYMGAFTTEIFRAGVLSIESGQWQAAAALGLSRLKTLRLVILPQAARRMVPPLVSQSVLQMKNTALLAVVAIPELMHRSSVMVSETFRPLEVYTGVAAIYFILLVPLVELSRRLELQSEGVLARN